MAVRKSSAVWRGTLKRGAGVMRLGNGAWEGPYSFGSRFQDEQGTNPEELIAAAHAGCFSMALAGLLEQEGKQPDEIRTSAEVTLMRSNGGWHIQSVHLIAEGDVPDVDEAMFQRLAEQAKANCPVSVALGGKVAIQLTASLAEEAEPPIPRPT